VTATNDGGSTTAQSATVTPTEPPPPPPPTVDAPTNLTAPVVTGTVARGRTLACDPGTWTGSPTLAYQWLRDGRALGGRTQPTYRVRGGDVGHALACRVTATNEGGSAIATSAAVPDAVSPGSVGLPSGGHCISGRKIKLRLRASRPARVKTVGVFLDGHKRVAVRGRALPAVVWVKRLPAKRFELSVRAVNRDGSWQYAARKYTRCRPGRAASNGAPVRDAPVRCGCAGELSDAVKEDQA
jgi:hypothetical protein